MNNENGILYGVGVGPGDPELVTLKALRIIRNVAIIAFPVRRRGARSRALETVRIHLRPETTLLPLLMPMTKNRDSLAQAHEQAAASLAEAARGGRDVAYLSLGDPLFYSTFGYLAERFPGKVEVISGIAAMNAFAAAIGLPLASGDSPTAVVTGGSSRSLKKALEMGGSVIIMKPRSLSEEALGLLESDGAFGRASAAIELGGPSEQIIEQLDRKAAANLPYFSIIWIKQP
ncbi:MAG: precorrin-2 C(20)-methyltransferase [Thermoleophilia bacterium]|nr:precorrin-2 C(20)-methyltransferase [Thermoleophilia bacterium]